MSEIRFFIRENPYGGLSNFERTKFYVGGELFKTNEHYYQAQKANDQRVREYIKNAPHARIAMVLGRQLERNKYLQKYMVEDWDSKKLDVMLKGLRCKFRIPRLRTLLLSTGDSVLHEDNPEDFYWGIGDGTGESWLGKLLMQVRDELQTSNKTGDKVEP